MECKSLSNNNTTIHSTAPLHHVRMIMGGQLVNVLFTTTTTRFCLLQVLLAYNIHNMCIIS
jgi:hypothetical protein